MANAKIRANAKKVAKKVVKKVADKAVESPYGGNTKALREEFRFVFMRCFIIASENGRDEIVATACSTAGFAFGIAAAGVMPLKEAQDLCGEWAAEIFEEKKARMIKKALGGK
jgi:hypothetical protein